jgi:uncharacterized membrane protein YhaH (DUF805 family)
MDRYLRLKGRASATEFIVFALLFVVIYLFTGMFFVRGARTGLFVMLGIIFIASWPLLAAHVRRLHDLGFSGLWLLLLIPVASVIPLVELAMLIPGQPGSNRFAPDPREDY